MNDEEVNNFNMDWMELNMFEQQVYLYKFCVDVGRDMSYMDGIEDADIVKIYNQLPAQMDDVFELNEIKKDNGCIIS